MGWGKLVATWAILLGYPWLLLVPSHLALTFPALTHMGM